MLNMSVPTGAPSQEAPLPEVVHSQPMNHANVLDVANPEFVTVEDLARLFGVATVTIYRLVARRALPTYRLVRRILFRRSDIERWLDAQRTEPRDPRLCQSGR